MDYVKTHYAHPLPLRLEKADKIGEAIMIDGNTACALGAIYGGATVVAWYPITPSTSIAQAFEKYARKLRVDPETGKNNYASLQAEDELAAIGMVIGATWNGARAFTTTSGPGVSLMNEFIGLSYFAEIPVVLINVQRGGPSTGMPTRTQQGDILSSAYASHGDTKHPLLLPSTPTECFEMTADAFDLADRLQTLVFVLSDLDLGMNQHLSAPLKWDDERKYDRGKVLHREDLEAMETDFGRYLDIDGDGIPFRTIPGTHPTKGAFFTRGTSHDEYAKYTEDGSVYARVMERLLKKWDTAKELMPSPEFYQEDYHSSIGMVFYGTTMYAALEAMDQLRDQGVIVDAMRIRAFPFDESEVLDFVEGHDHLIVIDQNRDGQMRTLLSNELEIDPKKMLSIRNYDGLPFTAYHIREEILKLIPATISE
jgi:2-oxoglutarate ferredoxin oxidoreductase subunit alpha